MAAARAFLRASDEAVRMGATRSLALCQYYLGNMAYFRGRFQQALQRLDQAIHLYRQVESPSGEAIALMMHGVVATPDGTRAVRRTVEGSARDPEELGTRLADELARAGATEILAAVRSGGAGLPPSP